MHINKEAWEFTTEESKKAPSGLHIGQSGRCKCLQYKGFIDEISVWNAAISPADIRLHWRTEPVEWHTNFDDIIAYWKFNTAHRLPSGNITSEYAVEGSGDKKINITIVESSDQDQTLFFNKTQMMGIPIPTYNLTGQDLRVSKRTTHRVDVCRSIQRRGCTSTISPSRNCQSQR